MTDAEWRDVDNALIESMDSMDPHELVQLLWAGDDDAWRYINARAVIPMLRRPFLGALARDWRRSDLDICGAVFDYLIARRKLECYQFKCPLVYWVRFWVLKDILEPKKKKREILLSDEEAQNVLFDVVAPEADAAAREEVAWCFGRLWKTDRKKARVLYLKVVEGRSAKEIMELLGISSEANVNQLSSRACSQMRQIRQECELPRVDKSTRRRP